jgi:hypothetical protein
MRRISLLVGLLMLLGPAWLSSAPGSTPLTGSKATEIDWSTVRLRSPIPDSMPALESDDPFEAGFAREWIERSLGRASFGSFKNEGRSTEILARPFALSVVSEKRMPDDSWAHGVDYELRRVVRSRLAQDDVSAMRVFCSAHGCLCYFESTLSTWREILRILRVEQVLEPLGVGVTEFQFSPHMINYRETEKWDRDTGKWWTLILIQRPEGQ